MKSLLILIGISLSLNTLAQPFKPDISGHVSGDAFLNFCKQRQYSLVGMFDSLPNKKGMAAQVIKNGAWMYVDLNGKEFPDHDALAKHYGFYTPPMDVDPNFYPRMPSDYDPSEVKPIPMGKYTGAFYDDYKCGYKQNDKIVVPALYDKVERMWGVDNYLFYLVSKDDLYGLCDYQGKLITPIVYNEITSLSVNSAQCFFIVKQQQKYGVLSRGGILTLPLEYEEIKQGSIGGNRVLFVRKNGLKGVIGLSGKPLLETEYEELYATYGRDGKSGLILRKNEKFGYMSRTGEIKVPCTYKSMGYNENNFLTFGTTTGIGAMDTNGVVLVEPLYSDIQRPNNANCFIVTVGVNTNKKIGIVGFKGNTIEAPQFAFAAPFGTNEKENEIFIFSKEKTYFETGFFNIKTLQWTLPCEYRIGSRGSDYATVIVPDPDHPEEYLSGVVDKAGKLTIPIQYGDLYFRKEEGYGTAKLNGKYGVIGVNNEVLLPFQYDQLKFIIPSDPTKMVKGYFVFEKNGKKGVIHLSGKITIPATYDEIAPTNAGMMCVSGTSTKIMTPEGKTYTTINHSVGYRAEGFFEWKDSLGVHGIDRYGRTGILPIKPQPRGAYGIYPEPENNLPVEPQKDDFIYTTVDETATFPGGVAELKQFIAKNITYPENAYELGISGKSYLTLTIEKDGIISDIKIARPFRDCPECDQAAIAMVKKMPHWNPAKVNGKVVRSSYNLPVVFRAY